MKSGLTFAVFLIALFFAVPIGVAMGFGACVPGWLDPSFRGGISFVINSMVGGINSTPLLAIPLFVLSGIIMTRGGLAKRLFDVFAYFIGSLPGGFPCAVIVTCLFYGALSGSAPATAAAVGNMTIPVLMTLGYDKTYSGALCSTAGSLGVIIPPSIPMIVYGLFTGVSIGDMFIAGILPGILIGVTMMAVAVYHALKRAENKELINKNYEELKKRGIWNIFKEGFFALLTPVIILGGIYGGIVTPTEAACVSVVYSVIICLFLYKTINFKDLWDILIESVLTYAAIITLIAIAAAFSKVITFLNVTDVLGVWVIEFIHSKAAFLIIVILFMFVLGMFMDVTSMLMIFSPILLPMAKLFGMHSVHFGIIMVICVSIGFVTPPFGVNLFIMSSMIKEPVMKIGITAVPFILAFLVALFIIAFVPWFSLVLIT